jgi:diguanylate cyclase (GGDEF)-like protein
MHSKNNTDQGNQSSIIPGFGHTDQYSLILNQVPFLWDLERGTFNYLNSDSVIFQAEHTLSFLLNPIAKDMGIDLFRLMLLNASSQCIHKYSEISHAPNTDNFLDIFSLWSDIKSTAGWGKFHLIEFNPELKSAVIQIDNSWELTIQKDLQAEDRWGCPFVMGRIIGVFQKIFDCHCWADDDYEFFENGNSNAVITVYKSDTPTQQKLDKLRSQRLTLNEKLLAKEIEEKTAELQKSHDTLKNIANLDFLTNLNNRRSLEDKLSTIKNNDSWDQYTLVFVDLDRFKIINDTCGHVAGDRLLTMVGETLTTFVDRNEHFVARYGGDEFTLLLHNPETTFAMDIANKIRNAISSIRFDWDGRTYQINCSIGFIPLNSIKSKQPDSAVIAADSACYQAKVNGRNQIYTSETIDEQLEDRLSEMNWVHKIKEAISDDSFELHFQLIRPIHSEKEIALEALVRMVNDDGELVLPGNFLPAAENYDVIFDLDCWVINDVFKKLEKLGSKIETLESVAINLSGNTISNPSLENFIDNCFKKYQVDPTKICFELTETHMMMNLDTAKGMLSKLRKHGCTVSLDDFGAGMSSFGYLRELPVDKIKIDGSFVKNMDESMVDYTFVESITNVAKAMHIKTIAEFVENERTVELLTDISVDYVQGFFVERPRPWDSIFNDNR